MSIHNPYQPPKAEVADRIDQSLGFQPVKVWSAKGRIGRLRYLAYMLGGYLAVVLAVAVSTGLSAVVASGDGGAMGVVTSASVLTLLAMIPFIVLSVLSGIQRCHDIGWSGWALLLSYVPLVNVFVALMWLFKAGDAGSNKFGLPPPPNSRAVTLLGWAAPLVIVLGIVMAIALPQYQQYTTRAKAAPLTSPY